jgi:1-deoxy-D-xylulose-5-phosphate synthase
VTFAIDRAGLVGGDGATHNGSFDLSYLRCIPNLVVMTPSDENECRQMLYTAYQHPGPAAVRYPRGQGTGAAIKKTMRLIPMGTAELKRPGEKIAILAFGSMLAPALQAAESCHATVVNMRFIKPLDTDMIQQIANSHERLVTVEENTIVGGAGSAVSEWLALAGITKPVLHLGLPDQFIAHGEPQALLAQCGLDAKGIEASIAGWVSAA